MVPPVTRSQAVISDERMREMTAADPEGIVRDSPAAQAARAAQAQRHAARRAAAAAAAAAGLPRLDRLPQEIHDDIARDLPKRSRIALASTSRRLHQAYQPAAISARSLAPLLTDEHPIPKLFDRSHAATDATLEIRLRDYLAPLPEDKREDPSVAHVSHVMAYDRPQAVTTLLRHSAAQQGSTLHGTALALTRPVVEAMSKAGRGEVLDFMADRAWPVPTFAPDVRWCLDLVERHGARSHSAALARLAVFVRDHFRDDPECTETFRRFEALARQLDREGDPGSLDLRRSLASTWYRMPDAMDVVERLLVDVADRPSVERERVYLAMAESLHSAEFAAKFSPERERLSAAERSAVASRINTEAVVLSDGARQAIFNATRDA